MPVDPLENFINRNRSNFDGDTPKGNLWGKIAADLGNQPDDDGDPSTESRDSLSDFIRSNRDAFDSEDLPDGLWNRILAALPVSGTKVISLATFQRRRKVWIRAAAAAVAVLLVSTLFLGREMGYRAAKAQELAAIEAVAPDFLEMEDYYQDQIETTYRQVSQLNEDPALNADLAAIDQAMEELREELVNVPREQQADLIARLIESYQIKLRILERILQHLPENAAPENDQNETNNDKSYI